MIQFLFGPTTFVTALLQILIAQGIIAAIWYALWYESDKKKAWFVSLNTNTGKDRIFRAKPGHEGFTDKSGDEPVFVKLEYSHRCGQTTRGPVFVYDSDTGQIQKPLKSGEGVWEGLDGKWWLKFKKAEMESRATQAAGGNTELYRYLLIGAVVLLIPICIILWKVTGFGGGA